MGFDGVYLDGKYDCKREVKLEVASVLPDRGMDGVLFPEVQVFPSQKLKNLKKSFKSSIKYFYSVCCWI